MWGLDAAARPVELAIRCKRELRSSWNSQVADNSADQAHACSQNLEPYRSLCLLRRRGIVVQPNHAI